MSDDSIPSPEEAPTEEFEKPKVRRISNKNPRKTAKEKDESPAPEASSSEPPSAESPSGHEPAPQNEAPTDESGEAKPEQKRNNRRRRGKGKSSNDSAAESPDEETLNLETGESQRRGEDDRSSRDQGRNPRQNKSRSNVDPEKVANKAWKIYLAEVSEEGVALIGDNDARELARRCFRLAELFLEEEQRRN